MKRRDLLRGTAIVAPAIEMEVAAQQTRSAAPSDRIRIGLIGCGGMGTVNLIDFQRNRDVEIVAVCDVNQQNASQAHARTNAQAIVYNDYRKLLERKDVDAVVIATPDHWHAKMFVDACAADKDIYVEKPIANSVREGRLMVEASRKSGRVVQVGLQQRSGTHFQRAVKLVQDGQIGTVRYVQCFYHSAPQASVGERMGGGGGWPAVLSLDPNVPDGLDWDFWLGPAPSATYSQARQRGWRSYFDYGGGTMTDWGVHLVDIALWAMKAESPLNVVSLGNRYTAASPRDVSRGDTADTQIALYEFPGFLLQFSKLANNSFGPNGKAGSERFGGYGTLFHGSQGTLFVDRAGYELFPQWSGGTDPNITPDSLGEWGQASMDRTDDGLAVSSYFTSQRGAERGSRSFTHFPHVRDFLNCVKTRNQPRVSIEDGHMATTVCQLANVSLRSGQKLEWDGKTESIVNSPRLNEMLTRKYRDPWRLNGL
jgi:predicted dehydrogenase